MTFHHIHGDGEQHRKELIGSSIYSWIINVGLGKAKERLALLCKHCHREADKRLAAGRVTDSVTPDGVEARYVAVNTGVAQGTAGFLH